MIMDVKWNMEERSAVGPVFFGIITLCTRCQGSSKFHFLNLDQQGKFEVQDCQCMLIPNTSEIQLGWKGCNELFHCVLHTTFA